MSQSRRLAPAAAAFRAAYHAARLRRPEASCRRLAVLAASQAGAVSWRAQVLAGGAVVAARLALPRLAF